VLQDPQCVIPQVAGAVVAGAVIGTDAKQATRAIVETLGYQP
jgi:hypothetical protein